MAGVLNVDREWKHLLKIDATWVFPGSPVVKLHTPNVRLLGLIPSGRTGVPHATQGSQKKKKDTCIPIIMAALFTLAKIWKQQKYP